MIDLLILTSCIKPVQQEYLKLTAYEERYKQTIDSLKFYIDYCNFSKIVLCDGSGYSFDNDLIVSYAEQRNVSLEILSFFQDFDKVRTQGKGFGEGEIMHYIVSNSKLYSESRNFVKITGRLIIENIVDIINKVKYSDGVYFNIIASRYMGSVDTRIYIIPCDLYKHYFNHVYNFVDDNKGETYEIIFGRTLKENKIRFYPLPEVPIICGYSGTDNKRYKKDSMYYLMYILTKVKLMNTKIAYGIIMLLRLFEILKEKISTNNINN